MQISRRPFIVVFLIFSLFFVPYFAAVFLYRSKPSLPTLNHGQLLRPMLQLSDFADVRVAPRQWYLVYVMKAHDCDTQCVKDIVTLRQVRLALNADAPRAHRVLVSPQPVQVRLNKQEHPDLEAVALKKTSAAFKEGFYLADQFGHLFMFYGKNLQPKPIYKDLRRLLQYG